MLADILMQAALQGSGNSSRKKRSGRRQRDAAQNCWNLPSSCPYPQLWWPVMSGELHPASLSALRGLCCLPAFITAKRGIGSAP